MDPIKFPHDKFKYLKWGYLFVSFIIICIFNQLILRVDLFKIPMLIYSIWIMGIVIANLYLLRKIFTVQERALMYGALVLFIPFSYVISLILTSFPVSLLALFIPENPTLERWKENLDYTTTDFIFSTLAFGWMTSQFYFHFFFLFGGIVAYKYLKIYREHFELQSLNSKLELDLLKSQLHPHFFFNTLNNLYRLVMKDPKAGTVVLKLADLMRYTLYESNSDSIPLKTEISFLIDYIELEKIRHKESVSIQYNFSIIKDETLSIPPLLFINFVENAFKHGVNNSVGDSYVDMEIKQDSEKIMFFSRNSKPPIDTGSQGSLKGKGLQNITKRLQILYPDRHALHISDKQSEYIVTLEIFLKNGQDN